MSTLVKSLKRLYERGSAAVTIEKLQNMVSDKTITEEDYLYITGMEYKTESS